MVSASLQFVDDKDCSMVQSRINEKGGVRYRFQVLVIAQRFEYDFVLSPCHCTTNLHAATLSDSFA